LEPVALERNVAGESVLGLLALLPVVRFLRHPGQLLVSGLIAWGLLSATYCAMGLHFYGLTERWSTFEIFMKGGVGYLLASSAAWVGACAWRARSVLSIGQEGEATPALHHPGVTHSNHHTS